ncbi:MAG: hypothetical protein MZV70_55495 [Desulfobacterales bacterium]|nr:hypothetical protein [Desulfobacterales bacterium]
MTANAICMRAVPQPGPSAVAQCTHGNERSRNEIRPCWLIDGGDGLLSRLWAVVPPTRPPRPPELNTFEQKLSYVLGREIGQSFQRSPGQDRPGPLHARDPGRHEQTAPRRIAAEEEQKVKAEFSAQMQAEQAKKLAAVADQNCQGRGVLPGQEQIREGRGHHRERPAVPGAQGRHRAPPSRRPTG